jgi:restriction endonuclease Mrr
MREHFGTGPQQTLDWQGLQRDYVLKLLARVTEEERMLLMMKEVEGYSYADLSDQTGQSVATIKKRLQRARAKLVSAASEYPLISPPAIEAAFLGELPVRKQVVLVAGNFEQLLRRTNLTPEDLLMLSPREFEELIAELWTRFDYEVELTARTRDGGRDIIAVRKREADVRILVECKRYTPPRKVGIEVVRSLYGVKIDEKATKAVLATTTSFTSEALRLFAAHQWELEPRDYEGVVEWINLAKEGLVRR